METIKTYYLIYILAAIPTIIYLIMLFNHKYMNRRQAENEQIYIDNDIYNQLVDSGYNALM